MNKKSSFSKILIIQTAFIGDVILATPVIEKLSCFYPAANIDFLLRKGNEGLLAGNPTIRKVLIWDKKKNKIKNLFRVIREIRKEKYDLVVNLQRFFSSGMVTVLSKGKMTLGFDKNPLSVFFSEIIQHQIGQEVFLGHEIERNLLLIRSITDERIVKPKLYPSEADFKQTHIYKGEKYVCVAPASVWFTKQFPWEKWVDFINAVPESVKVYLMGGPQDKELCALILGKVFRKGVVDLCGKLSFQESAALMKDAHMNYVNDSAPMHIASAMNAPVCAVYCSTVPEFGFGPLSDSSHIVEIEEKLDCRPCGLHGHQNCPKGHFKCGFEIKTEQLLEVMSDKAESSKRKA